MVAKLTVVARAGTWMTTSPKTLPALVLRYFSFTSRFAPVSGVSLSEQPARTPAAATARAATPAPFRKLRREMLDIKINLTIFFCKPQTVSRGRLPLYNTPPLYYLSMDFANFAGWPCTFSVMPPKGLPGALFSQHKLSKIQKRAAAPQLVQQPFTGLIFYCL